MREFQRIAKDIPVMHTATEQKTLRVVQASEVLASGQKTVKGKPVDPSKTYTQEIGEGVQANHKKAMLKLYEEKGKEAVVKYLADVFLIEQGNLQVLMALQKRINDIAL